MSVNDIKIPGYEVLRELGRGGMASVYLALQRSLDRMVALKVMKRDIDDLEKFERRFLLEGRTMAKIPHRNIVAVYDIVKGVYETYIAMEFLDGGSLSDRMKAGLSLASTISIVVQLAKALQFAHEQGVIHRDLKPANIMFRDAQTPVLTDFGIARRKDDSAPRLTESGMLVGTPTYMSPEQIGDIDVDGRSDLYSLGVLFYELLVGTPPFVADTSIAVLTAHLTSTPPRLPQQLADFQPVMDRLLAKDRENRYPSLDVFCAALKRAVVSSPALLTRLRSDPYDSLSDQLLALGFSIEDGNGKHRSTYGRFQKPIASARSSGEILPRIEEGQSEQIAARLRYLVASRIALATGAAVLLGLVIMGVTTWPDREIDALTKRTVDVLLLQVDDRMASGDLIAAADYVQLSREQAPSYPEVRERAASLSGMLKAEARDAVLRGNFDDALAQLERARLVYPEDAELSTIAASIGDGRQFAERTRSIQDLVERANAEIDAGNDIGPGGAMALLDEARALAPTDAGVLELQAAVVARLLKPARDALAANDLATARTAIDGTAAAMASEPEWRTLRLAVEAAEEAAVKRTLLVAGLQRVDVQIREGRLDAPIGDNASETLAALPAVDGYELELNRRRAALAGAFVELARSMLREGRVELALQSANRALNLEPGTATVAFELKRVIESRLDSQRSRVIELMARAEQALFDGRFVAPRQNNVRDLAQQVLDLDPGNEEAAALLREVPIRMADAAMARSKAGDLVGAETLAAQGVESFPENGVLATVAKQISVLSLAAKADRDRRASLMKVTELLAARAPSSENIAAAVSEISRLIGADSDDTEALAARARLIAVIDGWLSTARSRDDLERVSGALASAQALLPSDGTAEQLASRLSTVRARVEAEELSRVAARTGDLLLTAYPWANVESLVDANRRPVKLPAETTTPFRMKLAEGVYSVTFRHPEIGSSVTQVAQVEAGKSATASASFASTAVGRDYLIRAGW